MALTSVGLVKVVGTKTGPYMVPFAATMGSGGAAGKLTITAAQLGLTNVKYCIMSANKAGTGVGEIAYSTTDMSSAVTTFDVEVIKDESTLVSEGQLHGIAFGDAY